MWDKSLKNNRNLRRFTKMVGIFYLIDKVACYVTLGVLVVILIISSSF